MRRVHVVEVPDRFHGSFSDRSEDRDLHATDPAPSDRDRKEADSVLSVLTHESADDSGQVPPAVQLRHRSVSEFGVMQRRSSFVVGKEKMITMWERLFRKRKLQPTRNAPDRTPERSSTARESDNNAALHRVHSMDDVQPVGRSAW